MTVGTARDHGKGMFVKEALNDDPRASHRAIDEKWREAGMPGRISPTLVSRWRSRLGLSGKSRGGRRKGAKATGARRGRPAEMGGAPEAATGRTPTRGRQGHLMELEVELDRLLMKVAEIGTLPEVEESLRKTRRQLYAGLATRP